MLSVPAIYWIRNNMNGKVYIGSSNNFRKRKDNHLYTLRRNKHHNQFLQNAWNKYGEKSFDLGIIEECSVENLEKREQYYMDMYDSYNNKFGYNISPRSENTKGVPCSEETKRKIGKANRRAYRNGFSEDHRARLSEACIGKERIGFTVLQYTIDGEFVKAWNSAANASKVLGYNMTGIHHCCNGVFSQSNGFIWKYKYDASGKRDKSPLQSNRYQTSKLELAEVE